MKKVTYIVICHKNPSHKFPVVYEIKEGTEAQTSRPTEQCPFCGELVEVTVEGQLIDDTIVRKLGFKKE